MSHVGSDFGVRGSKEQEETGVPGENPPAEAENSKTFNFLYYLNDDVGGQGNAAVQIQPQVMDVTLRPNDPMSFKLKFRLAEKYPIDLYYLMDMSRSMADDKQTLVNMVPIIATEMRNFSDDFRLGFGSFVDKPISPYASTPEFTQGSCDTCEPTYGFRNHLPLDADERKFQDSVNRTRISFNIDAPEGGFDAIMQVSTCNNEIGWRERARHLLLFSTDSAYHTAGDGRLGGIVKGHDGECHMTNNMYTESVNQDYPSVGQVAERVKDENINVIFAVTDVQVPTYERLQPYMAGSQIGSMDDNSANVADLLRDKYLNITSVVELLVEGNEDVEVTFRTNCTGDSVMETNRCDNLQIGDEVTFDVTITAKECTSGSQGLSRKNITIKPVGLSDALSLNLDILCTCDCERSGITNSTECSNNGEFYCGVCRCNDGFYGQDCACNNSRSTDYNDQCIPDDSNSTAICSDRGDCVCGKCECRSRSSTSTQTYTGRFCECDDYNCPFYLNQICGGLERGYCRCGQCVCNSGWSGDSCGCKNDTDACAVQRGNETLECNGKGQCVCGTCECEDGYYGQKCEECTSCLDICRMEKACVQCYLFETGPRKDTCFECNAASYITKVEQLEDDGTVCNYLDEDDCLFRFSYDFDEDRQYRIKALTIKECPQEVDVLALVLGIVGALVLIGIIILVAIKVFLMVMDRRELQKFEIEKQKAQWEKAENPLYKDPTNTYKNPTFSND
ncbi:hypothetical protein FSP39_002913 [Pinctada imbricata]|uniref:Integrin beta n=1 Tax=Pinctada imbricata TaxID=66713 RepID=A0AA88YUS0_PINIB|nr:hypothetical protein FSP39_002913 [Pinctada imbricata]